MTALQHKHKGLRSQEVNRDSAIRIRQNDHSQASETPSNTRAAILGLPDELLHLIVDRVSDPSLKMLRLVHPRFAHLEAIMERSFQEVTFRPRNQHSPQELQALADLVHLVHNAGFLPVVIERHNVRPARAGVMDYQEWDAQTSTENATLRHAYQASLKSGALQDFFVNALKLLPAVRSVVLSHARAAPTHCAEFPAIADTHALAFQCLATARTQIHELEIAFSSFDQIVEEWKNVTLHLDNCNVSGLKSLCVRDYETDEHWTGSPVSDMMRRSSESLEALTVESSNTFEAPDSIVLNMPKLRRIKLKDVQLDLRNLAFAISCCDVLEELEVEESVRKSSAYAGFSECWRPPFDELRNQELRIIFNPIYIMPKEHTEDPPAFFLRYNTARSKEEAVFRHTGDEEMTRKCQAVIDFISGENGWELADDE
ncbi:hypothetical protein DOTSEDRAFT_32628 [Dothistroma septosporum NZE10]|uniref:F-box domain-containing protein n=1 Tax=Dothistroma septosporum (strain NZE10 / CBS 128990) TaxID=675120 RepID=N1PR49_DOTSN|nr:hypothetical protein DOTSEDRAFT_32628 [Dothistroma septosporum NZE10]